jgi:hypothetical protein
MAASRRRGMLLQAARRVLGAAAAAESLEQSSMIPLAVYSPLHLVSDNRPPLEQFGYRFLAEGDSWFTIGTLNPAKNSSLLFEMAFSVTACAVNCAYPGDKLGHMGDASADPYFTQLLFGRRAEPWDGIFLSAGGNDLIDAIGAVGAGLVQDRRLLLTSQEWGPPESGAARYISEPGWKTFESYIETCLTKFVSMRDRAGSQSKGVPIFLHGYAMPTPRNSGAGLGAGPWLLPALVAYGIPQQDQPGLAREFIGRLGALFTRLTADRASFPNVHFFDSSTLPLAPAASDATGESGDWVNEIHLTWRGYEKISQPWSAAIEMVMKAR